MTRVTRARYELKTVSRKNFKKEGDCIASLLDLDDSDSELSKSSFKGFANSISVISWYSCIYYMLKYLKDTNNMINEIVRELIYTRKSQFGAWTIYI